MTRRIFFQAAAAPAFAAFAQQVSDDALYDTVKRRLANDATVKGGTIDVEVRDSVVTLKGSVGQDKQKERAEKLVKRIKGVRKVVNQLQVMKAGAR
jgi:osmotically-inducible protein OsmY